MIDQVLIEKICCIAIKAGDAIASIYRDSKSLDIQKKDDGSSVTKADLLANQIIVDGLKQLPIESYPIISEESELAETADLSDFDRAWLVDPLDGTKGFIAGHPNFTVNIALIKGGYPVFGVIVHPLTRECIWAAEGEGVYIFPLSKIKDFDPPTFFLLKKLVTRGDYPVTRFCLHKNPTRGEYGFNGEAKFCDSPTRGELDFTSGQDRICQLLKRKTHTPSPWRILTGRYQNIALWQERLKSLGPLAMQAQNSSYKFCTLAKGEADIYPRGAQISAWDTAAGQCILEEAGGAVIDFNGDRLCYTGRAKSDRSQPRPGFIALSDAKHVTLLKELLEQEGVIKNDKSR